MCIDVSYCTALMVELYDSSVQELAWLKMELLMHCALMFFHLHPGQEIFVHFDSFLLCHCVF